MRHIATLITLFALGLNNVWADTLSLKQDGLLLHARLEKASDNWQSDTVLLMTHGTLAHNRMEIMATLQSLFSENGLSSLAINLGLGLSGRTGMYDCATPHTHRHTDALDEIGLWLNWLKQQGVKSVVLLGHSRGGNQTAWFANERDESVIRGSILIAPPSWNALYAQKNYQKRYNKALAPVLSKAQQLVDKGRGDTLLKPINFIYCRDTAATAEAFVSYYKTDKRRDTPYLINGLKKPSLVIEGSEDSVVAKLSGKINNDKAQLLVIDGADHYFRDLYAEELVEAVIEFIEAL